jgi:hypothetical protein
MNAWFEDLREFRDAIRSNGAMKGGTCPNYPVDAALDIYRNNYRGNLQGALALAYPVTKQLVGDDFFKIMAIRYIELHPSKSGNLHDYGANLGDFLGVFPNARELAYLPDIAKLEWACHLAYFAEDAEALDIAALASIAPDEQERLHFRLNPACRIIRSQLPIVDIWQAHQPGMPEDFCIDLDRGPQNALVSRMNDIVRVEALGDPEADWVEGIQAGASLWAVTALVLDKHPDFDLESQLARCVSQGILIDFYLETEVS